MQCTGQTKGVQQKKGGKGGGKNAVKSRKIVPHKVNACTGFGGKPKKKGTQGGEKVDKSASTSYEKGGFRKIEKGPLVKLEGGSGGPKTREVK